MRICSLLCYLYDDDDDDGNAAAQWEMITKTTLHGKECSVREKVELLIMKAMLACLRDYVVIKVFNSTFHSRPTSVYSSAHELLTRVYLVFQQPTPQLHALLFAQ
jgi:hypothetical protein